MPQTTKWMTEWRGSGEMRTATASGRGGVGRCGSARMEEGVLAFI